jgi:hypothetical protein
VEGRLTAFLIGGLIRGRLVGPEKLPRHAGTPDETARSGVEAEDLGLYWKLL